MKSLYFLFLFGLLFLSFGCIASVDQTQNKSISSAACASQKVLVENRSLVCVFCEHGPFNAPNGGPSCNWEAYNKEGES